MPQDLDLLKSLAALRLLCVATRPLEIGAGASSSSGDKIQHALCNNLPALVLFSLKAPQVALWLQSGVERLDQLLPHGWDGGMDALVWEQVRSARVQDMDRMKPILQEGYRLLSALYATGAGQSSLE